MPGAQLQFPNARPSLCARGLWLACVLSVLCFAHAAAAANDSATAKTASPFSISKGPPPGFADLAAKQTTQADVYYGGIFLTSTFVEYDASSVEILDPLSVISMIPNVKDPAQLAALLSGPRSTNAAHLCHKRAAQDCGSLTPDMVDVLFDENRFRLDLFVSSTELLIHQLARQKYLPPSSVERSTLHNVRVNLSGTGRDERYTLSSESFYAMREKRLRARYGFSNEGISLHEMSFQQDNQDTEYEYGSFRTLGRNIAFSNDLDVFGVRVASSTKRRLDLAQALGTEVLLFLRERSRVDVYRGNELIHSRYYEAGNQQIDTEGFPDGAYDIRLHITGHSGSETDELQFFVRHSSMPPVDEPQYYVEFGELTSNVDPGLPEFIGEMWSRGGASFRLREDLSMDAEYIFAGGKNLVQSGLFALKQNWQLYSGLMLSDAGDVGVTLTGGARRDDYSLNFDYREVRRQGPDLPVDEFDLVPTSYRQGTATFSMPVWEGRLFLRARLNERRGRSERSMGFSYFAPVVHLGPFVASFSVDGNYAQERSWVQAGVQMRWRGRDDYGSVTTRARYADDEDFQGTQFLASGRWNSDTNIPRLGHSERAFYFNHDRQRSSVGAQFRPHDLPQSNFELGVQRNDQRADLYYAMNNTFSVAHSKGRTTFGDGGASAGAVVIHVDGALAAKFAVLVNNRVVGHVWAGTPNVISLRPYETYDVRVQPVGDNIVGFDDSSRSVTLYPGNVEHFHFTAHEVTVLVGQLLHEDGTAVQRGRFLNVEGYGATDLQGWFQVEVGHDEPLLVRTQSGHCRVKTPSYIASEDLVVVDTLVCVDAPDIEAQATQALR